MKEEHYEYIVSNWNLCPVVNNHTQLHGVPIDVDTICVSTHHVDNHSIMYIKDGYYHWVFMKISSHAIALQIIQFIKETEILFV